MILRAKSVMMMGMETLQARIEVVVRYVMLGMIVDGFIGVVVWMMMMALMMTLVMLRRMLMVMTKSMKGVM